MGGISVSSEGDRAKQENVAKIADVARHLLVSSMRLLSTITNPVKIFNVYVLVC